MSLEAAEPRNQKSARADFDSEKQRARIVEGGRKARRPCVVSYEVGTHSIDGPKQDKSKVEVDLLVDSGKRLTLGTSFSFRDQDRSTPPSTLDHMIHTGWTGTFPHV